MRIVLRSAGLLLLVLPFLPAQRIFGESPAPAGLVPVRVWLLGMFIVLGLALVLSLLFAVQLQRAGAAVMRWVRGFEDGRFAAVCICLICTELVLISAFAFSFRYHLIDSAAQLFQARIFAGGEVSGTLPAPAAFFYVQNM
ncbi:MAG TPA: hypothetical protein PLP17_17050, partial [Oligoflexia bacterium]|nr:hypothetical protein [Oligoflexia bacterium]